LVNKSFKYHILVTGYS